MKSKTPYEKVLDYLNTAEDVYRISFDTGLLQNPNKGQLIEIAKMIQLEELRLSEKPPIYVLNNKPNKSSFFRDIDNGGGIPA